MNSARFALRSLRREWRAGELRVLFAALVIAVASVSAVGFFTDRVQRGMAQQAGELLAADRVVASNRPLPAAWLQELDRLGLAWSRTVAFRSVVLAGDAVQMAEVKAVEAGYPLRGELRVAAAPFAAERPADGIPPPGEVWVEPRLLQESGRAIGETVELGALGVLLGAVIAYEPDRGGELFNIAPRVLMNRADLPATELIQPGSQAEYRLLLAGEEAALAEFSRWVEPRLAPGERLMGVRDARPEMALALARADRFLGLAALVSVLLAGVAVAMAARRYAARRLDSAALLRCLGASERFIGRSLLLQLVGIGLLAALVGAGLGYLAQAVLANLMGSLFAAELPRPSLLPVAQGGLVALVTLAGFAFPPVRILKRVPPLRVLRNDLLPAPPGAPLLYGAAIAALLGLMLWQVREPLLVGYVFAGTVATLALLAGAALLLIRLLAGARGRVGVAWRFGIGNIVRRRHASVAQMVAFGLGIMVLLLLSVVRGDLLAGWRESLPPDAPNQFVVNVLPDQVAEVRSLIHERVQGAPTFYPMVRARLLGIGGEPVMAANYDDPRAQRLVQREFNLSWSTALPPGNRVVGGHWWDGAAEPGWSVEAGLAETLGIELGDRLEFLLEGQPVAATVTNLRSVDWDSFQVNFFVLGAPGLLESYPATWITSYHLPAAERALPAELVKRFPNVTVVDIGAIMERVRSVIDRVALAAEFVFAFTLLAGLVVLAAAIQSTHDQRLQESAILRTLGARRGQILGGLLAEFTLLGLLAGFLAAVAATLVGWMLAEQVFQFGYRFNPWVVLYGTLGGALGVGLAGLLGTRAVLRHPPLWTLRRT